MPARAPFGPSFPALLAGLPFSWPTVTYCRPVLFPLILGLLVFLAAGPARADESVIKFPGRHPSYVFEAEPHVLLAPFDEALPGIGFRGTFTIVENGFVKTINNSVGIGVGADFTRDHMWVPVVMQWNFWLTRNWSVFGEPGVAIRFRNVPRGRGVPEWIGFYAGGRYHFSDTVALTMRIGRPTVSVGVSFLL